MKRNTASHLAKMGVHLTEPASKEDCCLVFLLESSFVCPSHLGVLSCTLGNHMYPLVLSTMGIYVLDK